MLLCAVVSEMTIMSVRVATMAINCVGGGAQWRIVYEHTLRSL